MTHPTTKPILWKGNSHRATLLCILLRCDRQTRPYIALTQEPVDDASPTLAVSITRETKNPKAQEPDEYAASSLTLKVPLTLFHNDSFQYEKVARRLREAKVKDQNFPS